MSKELNEDGKKELNHYGHEKLNRVIIEVESVGHYA